MVAVCSMEASTPPSCSAVPRKALGQPLPMGLALCPSCPGQWWGCGGGTEQESGLGRHGGAGASGDELRQAGNVWNTPQQLLFHAHP